MRTTRQVGSVGRYLGSALFGVVMASEGRANDTCNGFINIDYVGAPAVTPIGETVELEVRFGTGSIQGGTKMSISSFQMNLDCNANFPLTPPCTDEGPLVQYEGDGEIVSDCPTNWTTSHGVGTDPNEVIFTADPPLEIPANQPTLPGFCSIRFKVRVLGASIDGSGKIEQLVGYDVAQCDNGVLLSGGFQTAAIRTPPELEFSCYEVVRSGNRNVSGVTLEDRFGSTVVTVKAPKRLCAPTNVNGTNPAAPAQPEHLLGYEFNVTAGSSQKPKGIQIANQFGTFTANLAAPVLLLTPASKSLVLPFPPPLLSPSVPHFQCYKLSNVKGDASATGISVEDQLAAITLDLDKRGYFRLCVPVNKNGEDPAAPADPSLLMCFNTRNDRLPFNEVTAFATDQFGPLTARLTQYDELCVPSVLLP